MRAQNDDSAVKEYGIDLAVSMMRVLRKEGIRGYHLCTLNLEKSVTRVLEKLDWVNSASKVRSKASQVRTFCYASPRRCPHLA